MPTMDTTTFPSVCADVAPPRLALPSSCASSSGAAAAEAEPSAAAIPGAAGGTRGLGREAGEASSEQ